ncbi:VWA domain-containing protein [Jannaschia pagri]|uniref:VWA domain-containing protein n=1 Tax=Jannaschia pagri TaxID=2829797 RepID=A0ABQ4NR79_9RHOB|nr:MULTISPECIES: VWA domain-containing protein [unclassified Jannaschia]GIT93085.1 VWA domain-containing protein [Jannaschia sp. AI_61]GIT96920.1 VWA domain-containing protein [Jannaschia sp. AI_62]
MQLPSLDLPDDPKLAGNIAHFAAALRRAGVPAGPDRLILAIRAVTAAGFTDKDDFFHTLEAVFVQRPEHRATFAQLFRLYWRDPRYLEHMMGMLSPMVSGVQDDHAAKPAEKRAAQALLNQLDLPETDVEDGQELDIDASATASGQERLKTLDFEQMSGAEMAEALKMLATLQLPVPPLPSRRRSPATQGKVDRRATLRAALRRGDLATLRHSAPRTRWPNLVALCDISGSMSSYSRALLHFLHAVSNRQGQGWAEVHGFTFGTRLTNITRHLRTRDVDAALAAAGAEAQDWEGGTRIGEALHAFNRDWSRRVLGQGAIVLLVTDGLDRGEADQLAFEARRLHLTARRVIWLNPLLRWDGFAPKAAGIRALLPHVDSLRPGHSIASLEGLADMLSRPDDPGALARLRG